MRQLDLKKEKKQTVQVMAVNQMATSSILESSKIEVISVMHKSMSEFLPRCIQSFLLAISLESVRLLPSFVQTHTGTKAGAVQGTYIINLRS